MWTVIDEPVHLTTEQIEMALRGEVPVRALPKAEIERLYGTLTSDDPALD